MYFKLTSSVFRPSWAFSKKPAPVDSAASGSPQTGQGDGLKHARWSGHFGCVPRCGPLEDPSCVDLPFLVGAFGQKWRQRPPKRANFLTRSQASTLSNNVSKKSFSSFQVLAHFSTRTTFRWTLSSKFHLFNRLKSTLVAGNWLLAKEASGENVALSACLCMRWLARLSKERGKARQALSGHFDDRNGSSGDKICSRRLLRELCDGLIGRCARPRPQQRALPTCCSATRNLTRAPRTRTSTTQIATVATKPTNSPSPVDEGCSLRPLRRILIL